MQRPRQIIVCGCSRGGTTLFYNMLRSSIADAKFFAKESPALKHRFDPAPLIITKRPMDVHSAGNIHRSLGWLKTVDFIFVVRDPRALVSSHHIGVRDQFFQGCDYTMWVGQRASAFVKPGIWSVFQAIDTALAIPGLRHVVVRYEDLVRDPDGVQAHIATVLSLKMKGAFSDFHTQEIPDALRRALNGVRPVEAAGAASWRNGERLERVVAQFQQFPELFNLVERWGYETDRRWFDEAVATVPTVEPTRGTILVVAPVGAEPRINQNIPAPVVYVEEPGCGTDENAARVRCLARERATRSGPLLSIMPHSLVHADPWQALHDIRADCAAFVDSRGYLHDETLYFKDTPGARVLLDEWQAAIERQSKSDIAGLLHRIVLHEQRERSPRFTFHHLPINFCWSENRQEAYSYGHTLIEHREPSRPSHAFGRIVHRLSSRVTRRLATAS